MPNVKIYVDDSHYPVVWPALEAALPGIRDMLCHVLDVEKASCQFAVLSIAGLPDQPAINAELAILSGSRRPRDTVQDVARQLRDSLSAITGLHVAVRITMLNPETYVALK